MKANQLTFGQLLAHLRTEQEPFVLKRNRQPPQWSDETLHTCAYEQNPELYALTSVLGSVQREQRVRILFTLLQRSRAGMSPPVRQTLERVSEVLLKILHPDSVLTVFLALRRVRANHKHITRAILKYILNHPQLEDMVYRRRPAVVDAIEHALGKNTARGAIKAAEHCFPAQLLKFAQNPEKVGAILPFLYRQTGGTATAPAVEEVQYTQVHQPYTQQLNQQAERPKTITATNRGDISATLVHLYRGGDSAELRQALNGYVQEAAGKLPQFEGHLALVLDASASTRSYGEREFCALSQSVALRLVLEKCCSRLSVHTVGGSGSLPMPQGYTDLAGAVLDALEGQPDLVAIVSDGYENVYPGDLARVVATLPEMGIHTPVVFCHSKFTNQDDLELRRPATNLPQLEFWHQSDFEELLLSLFLMVKSQLAVNCLQEFLLQKLAFFEKEVAQWTAVN